MLTFKEHKIEVIRGLLEPGHLDSVQRIVRGMIAAYVRTPPDFFGPDAQVPLRYPLNRLHATEAIMHAITPRLREIVGADILPTYSFPTIYLPGAELVRHTDRPACEVTCTLTLINEPNTPWPICIEDGEGVAHSLELNPGDMAVYDGINFPHWRAPQSAGHFNVSVFYHYVVRGGPFEANHQNELRRYPALLDLYESPSLRSLFPKA